MFKIFTTKSHQKAQQILLEELQLKFL